MAIAAAADPSHEPWTGHDTRVLIMAAIGIAIVVLLIVFAKMHAFLALTIGSLFVGIASGISLDKVTASYETGVGGVLGYVGILIALGAMLGKLLADSGGADKVVETLLRGKPATLPWKMALIAGIIGIPMFFEIGLVLLIPVVMLAVRRTNGPAMRLGIPALAGLSVLHGFIPPHPGPLAAIGILHANVGITLGLGLIVAIPTVIVAGPLFGILAARMVPIGAAGAALAVTGGSTAAAPASLGGGKTGTRESTGTGRHGLPVEPDSGGVNNPRENHGEVHGRAQDPDATRTPSFGITLVTLLSPLVLMLIKAAADVWMAKGNPIHPLLDFIGDPVVALTVAVLLAMVTFGTGVGFSADVLTRKIGQSLLPIVGVMLIVGAGGGFKQVLVDGGTGTAIAKIAVAASLSTLLLGWIVAVLIRLATGSATVATVTAAGIIAPLASGLSPTHLALVVLAVGAGSLFFSHVNDAGFWLVKEYFGLTVGQTIKTWSVMETIISVMGLLLTWLLFSIL
ncbi:gluconate transporter [Arthrobacter sp. ERGS1:01]|uniref:GntT/GntP/DsdX family permease n=1 Tax=Arthrobacter sp. ERGS1:01 TaxID=1704044 RepID=UPI0006B5CB76|nr:SLC13 family permease [Arthrobacter sp. ERGS1:01]ALE07581.1 gluconate transporter [Arthrobacter sp. ERGS1:01]